MHAHRLCMHGCMGSSIGMWIKTFLVFFSCGYFILFRSLFIIIFLVPSFAMRVYMFLFGLGMGLVFKGGKEVHISTSYIFYE